MKRIKNIDLLRAGAILYIMLYHCYTLSGKPWHAHTAIHTFLSFGGEVGVTLFFLLSGYGIYLSLASAEERGHLPNWGSFMKKRCRRIMPQYYVCVTVLLIFMSTRLIGSDGFRHLFAYYTFTENLSPVTHGSINGALWTMGVIFQFYLIAPLLYRAVKKNWLISSIAAILFTVFCKDPGTPSEAWSSYFHYQHSADSDMDFLLQQSQALWCQCSGISLPFHPGGSPFCSACRVFHTSGNGLSVFPSTVFCGQKPVWNLSVAYARYHDSSGWFSMVQCLKSAALLAVPALYACDRLYIWLFFNPFYRPSKERIISHE